MTDANQTDNKKIENNKLTQAQSFKVMQYISCQRERIMNELPSFDDEAQRCTKNLGFKVTPHNLRSVARDSEQSWAPKINRINKMSVVAAIANKLSEAEKLIEQLLVDNQNLHAQLAQLRGAVVTLAKEAKCSPPPFAAKNDAPKLSVVQK